MQQAGLFSPRLVEVINVIDESIYKSFECGDYWMACDAVDKLVDKIGLDDYSFMVSKINKE